MTIKTDFYSELSQNFAKVFVFATIQEANPLLKQTNFTGVLQQKNINIYFNENKNTYVIITGIGFISPAVAISIFYKTFVELANNSIVFNVGFAGSYSLPKYSFYLVSKVTNFHTNDSFYPSLLLQPSECNYANLYSIMHVATSDIMKSHKNTLFDMESYAIAKSCQYFIPNHHIHFIKFVSDSTGNFENKSELQENYEKEFANIYLVTDKIYNLINLESTNEKALESDIQKYLDEIQNFMALTKSQTIMLKKALAYLYNKNLLHDKIKATINYIKSIQPLNKSQRNQAFHKVIKFLYDIKQNSLC